jgi:hypothetical protein
LRQEGSMGILEHPAKPAMKSRRMAPCTSDSKAVV